MSNVLKSNGVQDNSDPTLASPKLSSPTLSAQRTEAPEQPGPRLSKLNLLLDKSLASVVDTFSFEKLAECFPYLAQESPKLLAAAQSQISEFFRTTTEDEFQTIIHKRGLIQKLNQLDQLIEASKCRPNGTEQPNPATTKGQTHGADPATLVRARTYQTKQMELQRLTETYNHIYQQNNTMANELRDKSKALQEMKQHTAQLLDNMDKLVNTSSGLKSQALVEMSHQTMNP
ncbi:hypothetical protein H4R33_005191 [Dimargaris cristalligena]|uniref:Nnf1-domain-containing protein n=1 Tax=Dimargaris cristalligena TaxID=215637 RepID=A0A4P9ZV78_9FUNG|nr:hypothetical protein H4R33_005191 [Dimargaris cristalligena]RKP36732.1 Nnf1-domain-containing protein [Dimargaris cristalligena]|eukprot:RKP36732.1 Nnf1-domain-containing protein [Dimargaris cristalligena]